MEQSSSWEANSHSTSHIPDILWNLKVHYHVLQSAKYKAVCNTM